MTWLSWIRIRTGIDLDPDPDPEAIKYRKITAHRGRIDLGLLDRIRTGTDPDPEAMKYPKINLFLVIFIAKFLK